MSDINLERCGACINPSQFEAASAVAYAGAESVEGVSEQADRILQRFGGLQSLRGEMPSDVSPEQRRRYEEQFDFMEGIVSLVGSMTVWAEMSVADMCDRSNAVDCAAVRDSGDCPRATLLREILAELEDETRAQEVEFRRRLLDSPH